ncbi:hypothetical protein PIB30_070945 [Stylosanthes scabra]|uniref:Uncharacterized protein n=1 Tax=Stylosanthes scabra TaxID=79078 RepID=A0ABU6ZM94_9FABA|nr:hypothetical protein [Stylosanthes scabra]
MRDRNTIHKIYSGSAKLLPTSTLSQLQLRSSTITPSFKVLDKPLQHEHLIYTSRATSKGVYEVAPSDSTMLAKSLVDIATMLKEIKEGQQVTPTLLKRQSDN